MTPEARALDILTRGAGRLVAVRGKKHVRILRENLMGWWAITLRCSCGCGVIVRAAMGATLENARWNFRQRRNETAMIEENFR